MDTKELLIKSKRHMARIPLHKGSLANGDYRSASTPKCVWGAVAYVVTRDRLDRTDPDLEMHAKSALSKSAGMRAPFFNDAPETTKEDVLALFDKAIASLS